MDEQPAPQQQQVTPQAGAVSAPAATSNPAPNQAVAGNSSSFQEDTPEQKRSFRVLAIIFFYLPLTFTAFITLFFAPWLTVILILIMGYTTYVFKKKTSLNKKEDSIYVSVAKKHNLSAVTTGGPDTSHGCAFRLNGNKQYNALSTGLYDGARMQLFTAHIAVDDNNVLTRDNAVRPDIGNVSEYFFTVLSFKLAAGLASYCMINRYPGISMIEDIKAYLVHKNYGYITLEGDFDKYFELLAPMNTQIEVLSIFTPDVMSIIESMTHHITIEVDQDYLLLYSDKIVTEENNLEQFIKLGQLLATKYQLLAQRELTINGPVQDKHETAGV
jgi:hypothetical protein